MTTTEVEYNLTIRQAAKLSHYSEWHIRKLCRDGAIEYQETVRGYRINEASLLAYALQPGHGPIKKRS